MMILVTMAEAMGSTLLVTAVESIGLVALLTVLAAFAVADIGRA